MKESCETKPYILCFSGFLIEFLKQVAEYHQTKEIRDMETQTSPALLSRDSLGNVGFLPNFQSPLSSGREETTCFAVLCVFLDP